MDENDMRNQILSELINKMHDRLADKAYPSETPKETVTEAITTEEPKPEAVDTEAEDIELENELIKTHLES